MTHRIVLQRVTETQNTFGEPIKAWTTLAQVWAGIDWRSGAETFQGDRDYAEVPVMVKIRRASNTMGVREKDRALVPSLATTVLSEHITAAETAIDVDDASVFPPENDFCVRIGSELLLVTSKSGNTLTATRGVYGSTASVHAPGQTVIHLVPLDIESTAPSRYDIALTATRSEMRMIP